MFSTCFFQNFVVCHFMWWLCLEYLEVETLQKIVSHSNRVGIPPSPLRSGFAFASFYILVLYLFVNIQTHVYKTSKPAPSHLLLQYVNIPSPGSPTSPLCQCPLSSWNRQLLADETSVNIVSRRAQVLCVHIILLCLVDTQSGTPGLCPLCVDTANSTCVSRIPSLPPCATANITVTPPTSVSVSTFHLLELLFGNASNRGLIEHKVQKLEMIEQMCVRSKVVENQNSIQLGGDSNPNCVKHRMNENSQ